jgi:tetratricopeptide (TPR) repeat protein
LAAAPEPISLPAGHARILSAEGHPVEVSRDGGRNWDVARTDVPYCILRPGHQLRTGSGCRAVVQLSDYTVLRLGQLSYLEIPSEGRRRGFNLFRGILYFFHRDRPGEFDVQTPTVSAVVRGTEFNLRVEEDGTTTVSMFDGEVDLSNPAGQLRIQSGEGAVVRPGQRPMPAPVLEGENIIQWLLYYPGVLDVDDLGLAPEEERTFEKSLTAYRSGDLLQARAGFIAVWTNLPPDRQAGSDRIKVYHAALDLAVGNVTNAAALTKSLRDDPPSGKRGISPARLAAALEGVVATVKQPAATKERIRSGADAKRALRERRAAAAAQEPGAISTTEWMQRSLAAQAAFDLPGALQAARQAAETSPQFGFARARVAELEFGAGRIAQSRQAVEQSLRLAPRNAQAVSLRGYVLSAENRIPEALQSFDQAIALDGGLPTAWAGRGLCKIRQGRAREGFEDLQVAATLEPHVSIWRSYLGKAYSNAGDNQRARRELRVARQKDPNDPTPYLYSALLNQQENRINDAVRDLEKSLELNELRGLYRDQRLLDQDRAVRSANLATIYQDAGMRDVSVSEALRTLNADYANYPGHLFLGNSYNALRGSGRVDVRYETPAISEYLVANLQAPPSGGALSPYVTQQEYSKFFERDRAGFSASSEYLSRGAWTVTAAQYGNWGGSAYSLDLFYRTDPGQRVNNDLEQIAPSVTFKQALSPKDTIFFQGQYAYTESGDLAPNYYNRGDTNLRVRESIEPIALVGYHRAWTPFSHTLALGGFFRDRLDVTNPDQPLLYLFMNTNASRVLAAPLSLFDSTAASFLSPLDYSSEFVAGSFELQQVLKFNENSLIAGARFQAGVFDTESDLGPTSVALLATNATAGPRLPWRNADTIPQDFDNSFDRLSVYGYYNWRVVDPLLLTAGLSYDRLNYPQDFRYVPISDRQQNKDQVSPKAGVIWTPHPDTAVRAGYAQSLGGVSFDQSFRLEPSQVGGFNQSFRSFIPESVIGSVAGARFENAGVGLDQRFKTGTYVTLQGEWLHSRAEQALGSVEIVPPADPFAPGAAFQQLPSTTPQELEYYERNLIAVINQLVGRDWSFGVRYRLSDATLDSQLKGIPFDGAQIQGERQSILHQVDLFAVFNHPSGFFSGFDALWTQQSNKGYTPDRPGDDFWQFNAFVGYRFYRRHAEVRLALLNITDQDYHLNELNLMPDLPRDRTLAVSCRVNF